MLTFKYVAFGVGKGLGKNDSFSIYAIKCEHLNFQKE